MFAVGSIGCKARKEALVPLKKRLDLSKIYSWLPSEVHIFHFSCKKLLSNKSRLCRWGCFPVCCYVQHEMINRVANIQRKRIHEIVIFSVEQLLDGHRYLTASFCRNGIDP